MASAHQATPTLKARLPRAITTAGAVAGDKPAGHQNDMTGTIKGPGAMAKPARNADHPHAPCSQSTIDRSIAPKAAEKNSGHQ